MTGKGKKGGKRAGHVKKGVSKACLSKATFFTEAEAAARATAEGTQYHKCGYCGKYHLNKKKADVPGGFAEKKED
jgi:hypothetical protein